MNNSHHIKKIFIISIMSVIITRLINEFIYSMDKRDWVYSIVNVIIIIMSYFTYDMIQNYMNRK